MCCAISADVIGLVDWPGNRIEQPRDPHVSKLGIDLRPSHLLQRYGRLTSRYRVSRNELLRDADAFPNLFPSSWPNSIPPIYMACLYFKLLRLLLLLLFSCWYVFFPFFVLAFLSRVPRMERYTTPAIAIHLFFFPLFQVFLALEYFSYSAAVGSSGWWSFLSLSLYPKYLIGSTSRIDMTVYCRHFQKNSSLPIGFRGKWSQPVIVDVCIVENLSDYNFISYYYHWLFFHLMKFDYLFGLYEQFVCLVFDGLFDTGAIIVLMFCKQIDGRWRMFALFFLHKCWPIPHFFFFYPRLLLHYVLMVFVHWISFGVGIRWSERTNCATRSIRPVSTDGRPCPSPTCPTWPPWTTNNNNRDCATSAVGEM